MSDLEDSETTDLHARDEGDDWFAGDRQSIPADSGLTS